jgi:hypothetical protein
VSLELSGVQTVYLDSSPPVNEAVVQNEFVPFEVPHHLFAMNYGGGRRHGGGGEVGGRALSDRDHRARRKKYRLHGGATLVCLVLLCCGAWRPLAWLPFDGEGGSQRVTGK